MDGQTFSDYNQEKFSTLAKELLLRTDRAEAIHLLHGVGEGEKGRRTTFSTVRRSLSDGRCPNQAAPPCHPSIGLRERSFSRRRRSSRGAVGRIVGDHFPFLPRLIVDLFTSAWRGKARTPAQQTFLSSSSQVGTRSPSPCQRKMRKEIRHCPSFNDDLPIGFQGKELTLIVKRTLPSVPTLNETVFSWQFFFFTLSIAIPCPEDSIRTSFVDTRCLGLERGQNTASSTGAISISESVRWIIDAIGWTDDRCH